jgi:hypothetical protein
MPFDMLLDAVGELQRIRDRGQHLFAGAPRGVEGAAGEQACQVLVQRAHRRRDRHVIVVEDDQQVGVDHAGIVERLEGLPGGHRAVADDGDDAPVLALVARRHGHAQRGGNRGRGVADAEGVVFALFAAREAGNAALHAQLGHARAAAGQRLVRIGLVADVPDQAVGRGVEDIVQGHGEFNRAEIRGQVAAGLGYRFNDEGAQLLGQLRQGSRSMRRRSAGD